LRVVRPDGSKQLSVLDEREATALRAALAKS
jgi:hypothetical protein